MLAWLQRGLILCLVAAAVGWASWFGASAPWLAVAGVLIIVFGFGLLLALEFVFLHFVNAADPAPKPTLATLVAAWWGECVTAVQVFFWRQPFRANAVADHLTPAGLLKGQRGIVFVHGFFCNRGLWTPWLRRLQGGSHAFIALSLEPVFGSIDDYAPQIEAAVEKMTQLTGMPPLLVCHSMGGLAARAWLKIMRADARVHHVVTIGTPHRGAWLARWGHGHNARQMRLLSDWHTQLEVDMPAGRHALFTCWYSNCDNLAFPSATATLPGADNRLILGAAHVRLAFLPQVMEQTLAMLESPKI